LRTLRGGLSAGEAGALRCACGSLLARFVGGRLELKCKRCKRTVLVDLKPDRDGGAQGLGLKPPPTHSQ
jgi:hypothetical protein